MSVPSARHRFLSAIVLGILAVQYAAVGLVGSLYGGEPWPALVLPAFQRTWSADAEVTFERVRLSVVMEDESTRVVALGDLLAALPATHHPSVAQAHLACPTPAASSATLGWLRHRLRVLFPGATPERLRVAWETVAVPLAEGTRAARTTAEEHCALALSPGSAAAR